MMKYYEPDEEEKEILEAIDNGTLKRAKDSVNEIKKLQEVARNTLNKNKNMNIRVTLKTLLKLKNKASEEGIPYQTLAGSVLHKYVNGYFANK